MLYFRYLYALNSLSKSQKSNKIELPTIVVYERGVTRRHVGS